jgi:antitoxin HicB
MSSVMFGYEYPVTLVPDENDGGFVVTFEDYPEAITQGENVADALREAEDCLEEAVANRIVRGVQLPRPSSPKAGQSVISLPAPTAVKAAFYCAIRELNASKVELAVTLGVDEKEVRRLLDPHHGSKLTRIDELLRILGKRLTIRLDDIPASISTEADQASAEELPRGTTWNASGQGAGGLYVVASKGQGPKGRYVNPVAGIREAS